MPVLLALALVFIGVQVAVLVTFVLLINRISEYMATSMAVLKSSTEALASIALIYRDQLSKLPPPDPPHPPTPDPFQ